MRLKATELRQKDHVRIPDRVGRFNPYYQYQATNPATGRTGNRIFNTCRCDSCEFQVYPGAEQPVYVAGPFESVFALALRQLRDFLTTNHDKGAASCPLREVDYWQGVFRRSYCLLY